MNGRTSILMSILALAVLLKLSFWADQRSFEVQGVARMIAGPEETLYLLTNEEIIRVSRAGEVLAHWTYGQMGITEPVADLAVGLEGQVLVGLTESQEIRRYTQDGKFAGVIRRLPSPERVGVPGQHLRNFKFTHDERTGVLYVADSNHHRIQIYPVEGSEARVLTTPSGTLRVAVEDAKEEEADEDVDPALDPNRPFRYPNSLSIDGDRLYATDTDNHRIIVFRLDGTLDRILPTTRDAVNRNIFPVHYARLDDKLFVINRGPQFREGETIMLDLPTLRSRPLYPRTHVIDPLDLIVVGDDVLIADGRSRNILRYAPGGYYLGYFGGPSLQEVLQRKARAHRNYVFLRVLSLGGMVFVLLGLLIMKRMERKERETAGEPDVHQPLEGMQNLLGPAGSRRRQVLLVLVPGLGQIAAGRILRAIIIVPPLFFLVLLFLVALVMLRGQGFMYLTVMMFLGIVMFGYWAGVVLDGMRLNEGERSANKQIHLLNGLRMAGFLLITVVAGSMSQLVWEYGKRAVPDVPLAMQRLLGTALVMWGIANEHMAMFDAATVVGRYVGWGGAVAGMFGALAWRLGQERSRIARATVVGLLVGVLSWSFSASVPGSMLGGAFYLPLSQGALLGLAAYLQFRGPLVTLPVLPVAVAAAWTGNMLFLFLFPHVGMQFLPPGAAIRTASTIFEAAAVHLGILLVMRIREARPVSEVRAY